MRGAQGIVGIYPATSHVSEELLFCGYRLSNPICGAWMPNAKEPCARLSGHNADGEDSGHRSRYAMDNHRDARRAARRFVKPRARRSGAPG